jgi:hypothetical protein
MDLPVTQTMWGVFNCAVSNSDYVRFWMAFSVAKAVSRQYLNLEARFRSQGESIKWQLLCWYFSFPLLVSFHQCPSHSILLPPTLCNLGTRQRRWTCHFCLYDLNSNMPVALTTGILVCLWMCVCVCVCVRARVCTSVFLLGSEKVTRVG